MLETTLRAVEVTTFELDDTYFESAVASALQRLRDPHAHMRHPALDPSEPQYYVGLPELTAFWVRSRNREPVGCVYKYTRPPVLTGLISLTPIGNTTANGTFTDYEGWQGRMMCGYFLVIDMDFWHDRWILDYVQLVTRTGAHIEHRWNELSVQSMMWQVFVPDAKFKALDKAMVDVGHG